MYISHNHHAHNPFRQPVRARFIAPKCKGPIYRTQVPVRPIYRAQARAAAMCPPVALRPDSFGNGHHRQPTLY